MLQSVKQYLYHYVYHYVAFESTSVTQILPQVFGHWSLSIFP